MPEEFDQKRSRSVVVTGVGLISSLGVRTEEPWQAILKLGAAVENVQVAVRYVKRQFGWCRHREKIVSLESA